jgi:hypothetical protein
MIAKLFKALRELLHAYIILTFWRLWQLTAGIVGAELR